MKIAIYRRILVSSIGEIGPQSQRYKSVAEVMAGLGYTLETVPMFFGRDHLQGFRENVQVMPFGITWTCTAPTVEGVEIDILLEDSWEAIQQLQQAVEVFTVQQVALQITWRVPAHRDITMTTLEWGPAVFKELTGAYAQGLRLFGTKNGNPLTVQIEPLLAAPTLWHVEAAMQITVGPDTVRDACRRGEHGLVELYNEITSAFSEGEEHGASS